MLALKDIYHRWNRQVQPVLDGVSLEVNRGEIVWIGGQNGVGKTTFLRVAGGILVPRRGSVTLDGKSPTDSGRAYQRRIGYLSAGDRGLHARLTVTQHLDYWARLAYVAISDRPAAVANAIASFGLVDYRQHRVDRLSQGWRQRVRLAMAFLHEPDVILLDEPRNSLDDDGYATLDGAIRRATDRGAGIVWCSPRGESEDIFFHRKLRLRDGLLHEEQQ
jgi:ABC-2 type transport system ATP-binding protein